MKKIILTLLLTLSALVNVNAVAAFSLDIDGNGTINASNDGLIIFKYLLNSNANNLHTTISSNAADDRKTTAQLKAYLDNSGDILDVDGNGTTNASNDGLIVFKYLLNSNANNLHTTIASNAPGSKTTTINLKAYLDQYISTDVSNLYSGDRPTELTAEQIAAANGAGTTTEHLDVLKTAEFSNYGVYLDLSEKQIWIVDTDGNIGTVYTRIDLGDNFQQLHSSLNNEEFQAIYLETIQAIWDLVNPITERQSRLNQLDALETKYNIIDSDLNEWGSQQLGPTKYVTYIYQLILGTFETYQFGEFDFIEDVTDWDTKLQELEDQIKREDRLNDLTDLVGQYGVTEITPFENSAISLITVEYKQTGVANENGSPLGFSFGSYADFGAIPQAEFDTKFDEFVAKLIADEVTAAEELVAIFALATSPTAFVDYPALDAEADGILQAERAQHIVDSLTNLNGVTVTYTINTTPKSFNVAKAGETTINVLQDSSSGSAVSLDTLSVFKDIYFQTIQAKWDILHTAVTRLNEIESLLAQYDAGTFFSITGPESDPLLTHLIIEWVKDGVLDSHNFGEFDNLDNVEPWADALQAFENYLDPNAGPTVESEVADIYAADTPPTAYASGSVIDTDAQAVAQEGTVRDTFINRLSSSLYLTSNGYDTATGTGAEIEIRDNNNASLDPAVFVTTDAGAFAGMSGQAFSDFTFKIVLAIWHLEHPNYVDPNTHAARKIVLESYNSIDGISDLEVKILDNGSHLTVYLTWDLNGVLQPTWHFSGNNPAASTGQVQGDLSALSPTQFETYRERLYNHLIAHIPPDIETEITAMYDAATHPEALSDNINDAAEVAYDNRSADANDPRLAFISKLNKFGVVFEGFNNSNGNRYVTFVDDTIDPIQAPVDGVNLTTANFQEWMLIIAREIWLYGHQDYIYEQRELDRIAEILAIDTVAGISINYESPTFTISNGDKDNISQIDISYAILNAYDDTDFLAKKVEVQTAYGVQSTNLATRTSRSSALINGNKTGYVSIAANYDDSRGDLFNISYGGTTLHEYADTHSGGYIRLENLTNDQYSALDAAITVKVVELTPTVAKELAAWFADTDTAPVGSAPEWLPTALYAKANTLSNGTERFALITDGLLSAYGVTITRGGAGGTGATVTTFILSKGDGYDVTFDWGAYSANGFNGSNASPELYRNLVFDVILAGWKLVNETNNTKRSDMLDQDLDITGNDVELITYGQPNYDWWIYFNVDGLQIPILSGGIASDPMYYNKYTVNPHDTYMTEVEFQRLVVFVTFMRDNFTNLKAITGVQNRSIEIQQMANDFGTHATISVQSDGSHHVTFAKNNGDTHLYPVQSNWTHAAGTGLEDLNPDSWVKFYAKCRGIALGI